MAAAGFAVLAPAAAVAGSSALAAPSGPAGLLTTGSGAASAGNTGGLIAGTTLSQEVASASAYGAAAVSRGGQAVGGFIAGMHAGAGGYAPPASAVTGVGKLAYGAGWLTSKVISNPEKTAAVVEFLRSALGGG